MKKIITALLFVFQLGFSYAQNYSGPESVEFDYARNRYLISNTTTHQIIALQNGVKTVFATLTGSGPHGLEIVGDTLYCCSGGGIKAVNLNTGVLIYTKNLSASFLNGITHDPSGNLFITDFSAKKIYRMNTLTRKFNVYVNATVSAPNGIIYDSYDGITPRLIFCNWSSNAPIKKINLTDSTLSTLTATTLSNCDGICKGKNGKFYVSSWGNQTIQRFDSTFTGGSTAVVTGLSNPADIFYNFNSDTLGVPNASNNTVSLHYLGTATSLSKVEAPKQFQISPNPSTGMVRIESAAFFIQKVTLYNSLMQQIRVEFFTNEKWINLKLPQSGNGCLFIKVNDFPVQKIFVIN